MRRSPHRLLPALAGLGLLLAQTACAASGLDRLMQGNPAAVYDWPAAQEQLSVPFEWHDGHLIVAVQVNGSAPLRFAFDSGASATVLFETPRTRAIALDVERSADINGVPMNIVNHATVALAGLQLRELTVLQVPLATSPIFPDEDRASFDGAIGYDLLSRFSVRLDYAGRRLKLSRGAFPGETGAGWQRLPIDVSRRVPYLSAQLQTGIRPVAVSLLVDTGAPSYVYVNPELAEGLEVPEPNYLTRGRGFGGRFERRTARSATFSIGPFRFPDQLTHFDRADFEDLGAGIGLIGNALLRNFELIFDYRSAVMALRPNPEFSAYSPADRSGLEIEPHRRGAILEWVAQGSAAHALGLRPGHILTHLDGQAVEFSNFDHLKERLSSPAATVELCWRDGEQSPCAELALADRLPQRSPHGRNPPGG